MKLITWNIQCGLGMDGRLDLARIVAEARRICAEPLRTMHLLSTAPETFGLLQTFAHPDERRERLNHLLTAARAFAVSQRKLEVDAVDQGSLELPTPAD